MQTICAINNETPKIRQILFSSRASYKRKAIKFKTRRNIMDCNYSKTMHWCICRSVNKAWSFRCGEINSIRWNAVSVYIEIAIDLEHVFLRNRLQQFIYNKQSNRMMLIICHKLGLCIYICRYCYFVPFVLQ